MKAYWIAHVDVKDTKIYDQYAKLATQAIESHGGEFLARGGRFEVMEGSVKARNVIAVFPSMEDALACYHSDMYGEALKHSKASSDRDVVILEGV